MSVTYPAGGGGLKAYTHTNHFSFIQRSAYATLVVASLLLLVGGLASSFKGASAGTTTINSSVGSYSLSISDTNAAPCNSYNEANSMLKVDVLPGKLASNCLTITATTDNPTGYTLTIDGPDNGQLTHTTAASNTMSSKSGSIASPSVFTMGGTNLWGFAIPSGQLKGTTKDGSGPLPNGFDASYTNLASNNSTNTARYAAVPTTPTEFTRTAAANATADHYNLYFASFAANTAISGDYTGVITISGSTNSLGPPELQDGEVMQLIGNGQRSCPTNRTRALDGRDGKSYWIRLIPNTKSLGGSGDLCWMETNLAYGGGAGSAYGDAVTLTQGSAANSNIGSNRACYGNNATMDASKTKCYWIPTGANPTVGVQTPSESTDGGATNPQYGYLYNWCAAMNGQAEACQISTASQPNQQANTGNGTVYNICPAGWRLPTGGTGGEFAKLATALGWTSGGPQSSLFANGLYMYSGGWINGSFYFHGSSDYYWSSTVASTAGAHNLNFSSSNVIPAGNGSKGNGQAVRCVAE